VSPTLKRIGPFRFFFYSNEAFEPRHVHVQQERKLAKFWLEPVKLAWSTGFASHELTELRRLVEEDRTEFLERWNEYFNR
jgi:hypothetical protein